jgi:hypothetical protein
MSGFKFDMPLHLFLKGMFFFVGPEAFFIDKDYST